MNLSYKMGIDPGKVNLGYALLDPNNAVVESGVLNVQEFGITNTADLLSDKANGYRVGTLGLERYVAYQGVHSAASEDILMVTGALFYAMESLDIEVGLARAIDWKPKVCKHLFRMQGFMNPSTKKKFDKEFSMAAAEFITGVTPETDHEADAICLAYYGGMK